MISRRLNPDKQGPCRRRLSLEQRVRLLERRHRRAEKKRRQGEELGQEGPWRHRGRMLLLLPFLLSLATGIVGAEAQAGPAATASPVDTGASSGGPIPEAVRNCEQRMARQGFSVAGLFNLGNAWLREGRIGEAVLNYERALWLAPRDAAVAGNLRIARQRGGLSAPAINNLEKAARVVPPNTLAWVGSAALALTALGLFSGRLLPPRWRRGLRTLAVVSAVLWLLSLADLGYWWTWLGRAVVLNKETPVNIAPAHAAAASFQLHAGEVVHLSRRHGDFIRIRTDDHRSGWLELRSVARIVPRTLNRS